MFDYWEMTEQQIDSFQGELTPYTDPFDYLGDEWFDKSQRLFQRAFANSLTDSTAHRYVREARLGYRYLDIIRRLTNMQSDESRTSERDVERFVKRVNDFEAEMRELGYGRVSWSEDVSAFASRMRAAAETIH
jgi:hypothetical protein